MYLSYLGYYQHGLEGGASDKDMQVFVWSSLLGGSLGYKDGSCQFDTTSIWWIVIYCSNKISEFEKDFKKEIQNLITGKTEKFAFSEQKY